MTSVAAARGPTPMFILLLQLSASCHYLTSNLIQPLIQWYNPFGDTFQLQIINVHPYYLCFLSLIIIVLASHIYLPWVPCPITLCIIVVLYVKALVGAFSVIVKTSPKVRLQLYTPPTHCTATYLSPPAGLVLKENMSPAPSRMTCLRFWFPGQLKSKFHALESFRIMIIPHILQLTHSTHISYHV